MMKKILMTMLLFVFVTAACSDTTADETNEAGNDVNNNQTVSNNEDNSNDKAEDEANDTEQNESEENDNTLNDNSDKESENQQSADNNGEAVDEQSEEDLLKDLSFKIFTAQKDEDYDFLKSILAEGASMDTEANTFYFDDIDYPHEMEFVQEDSDNLEYRYIHEDDDGVIIIGYGIVDYETEASYAIDFQFVEEDGKWKMKDMDKNA